MSDLQCAATLLLVPVGRTQALAGRLAGARIAHVWTTATARAVRDAEVVAADLGVGVTARSDLEDTERVDLALAEIADQHRGETVVVVLSDGDGVVELAIDGDGWVRRPWATGAG